MNMTKSTGREAPLSLVKDCHENRFIPFKDSRNSVLSLVDMRHTISRETPMISKIGNDDPFPLVCYERKSLMSTKCLPDFKKQVSRP